MISAEKSQELKDAISKAIRLGRSKDYWHMSINVRGIEKFLRKSQEQKGGEG